MGDFIKQIAVDDFSLLVVIAMVIALIAPYLYIRLSTALAVGKTVPLQNQLTETADHESTFYYFMSEHCSTCKTMTPLVSELQSMYPNIISIDINKAPELTKSFHVHGTPTLMAVKRGKITKIKLGGMNRKKILQFINS